MLTRPILFNGPMVRALLAGRKLSTRRPIRLPMTRGVLFRDVWRPFDPENLEDHPGMIASACPFGAPGDRLWVRETFAACGCENGADHTDGDCENLLYRASESPDLKVVEGWVPSIHMPRWASRLTYEVTEVRIQRFSEISEEDAKAEGVAPNPVQPGTWIDYPEGSSAAGWQTARDSYRSLIASLYGPEAWNKWCWAITFRRVP